MKKNKIFIYTLLIVQLFVFSGCNEWLELSPNDGVDRNNYWKTKEDVGLAMTGIYSSLLDDDLTRKLFLWGELRADMVTSSERYPNTNYQRVIEGEISAENAISNWASFYRTINRCNTLLKYAPAAERNDESFSVQLLKQYEAQALAVRSLMYFYLVRTFGDVPYIEEAYVDNSQEMSIAKTRKEIILTKIVESLRLAEQTIPYSYRTNDENKGKFTAWGVKTLLADVYLWQEDYAACQALCEEVLQSGQFALFPVARTPDVTINDEGGLDTTHYSVSTSDVRNLFDQMYYKGNCVESIFEIQFSESKRNPYYLLIGNPRGNLIAKTEVIEDQIFPRTEKPGVRPSEYYDIRSDISIASRGDYVLKQTGKDLDGSFRTEEEMIGNVLVYRFADVILMSAEALTQLDRFEESLVMLNRIRDRANAVESTDEIGRQQQLDRSTMTHFVMKERAREFAFEGKRWFDVLRQAKRGNYEGDNINYLINLALYSAPAEKVMSLQSKYRNFNSHYLPISRSELESNPLLEQNEFYKDR